MYKKYLIISFFIILSFNLSAEQSFNPYSLEKDNKNQERENLHLKNEKSSCNDLSIACRDMSKTPSADFPANNNNNQAKHIIENHKTENLHKQYK